MRAVIVAAFLFLALPAAADIPVLFDVTGVAVDDVLNVRKDPSASSEIVGTLAPDAKSIEVVRASENGHWGLINIDEGTGWASARYLTRSSNLALVPQPMRCFGTEPFWDMRVSWPDSSALVEFSRAGEGDQSFAVQRADGLHGRSVIMAGPSESDEVHLLAAVKPQYCSDGMSDREFGFGVELFLHDQGNWQSYAGCCTLSP